MLAMYEEKFGDEFRESNAEVSQMRQFLSELCRTHFEVVKEKHLLLAEMKKIRADRGVQTIVEILK